ncbi:MAG TPA: aldo/keto reductase, partial [Opitutus sp.]|nr:aldo/keto reductase [Opitutus sp.]
MSGSVAHMNSETRKTISLSQRRLGAAGPLVAEIGLGCMGMSEFYQPAAMNDEESIRVIHRFLDAGGNFLDTADMYG